MPLEAALLEVFRPRQGRRDLHAFGQRRLGLIAGSRGLGLISKMQDVRAQKLSRLFYAGTSVVDVGTSRQRRLGQFSVHRLDQLGAVIAMLPGNQLGSQQSDEVQQRQGCNIGYITQCRPLRLLPAPMPDRQQMASLRWHLCGVVRFTTEPTYYYCSNYIISTLLYLNHII